MKCTRCNGDNSQNYVVCRHCGQRRVIQPVAGQSTGPAHAAPNNFTFPSKIAAPAPPAGTPPGPRRASPPNRSRRPFARDATRYLCAAMQVDSGLSTKAIESVLDEPYKAVASSPGVDLATVLKYALAARSRQRLRDLVLTLLPAVWLLVLFLDLENAASILPQWTLLIAVALWGVVFAELLYTYYAVIFPRLRRDSFDPAEAPVPPSRKDQARLAEIADDDRGNVVMSAMYRPFVGYGFDLETWSVTLNMARAEEGKTVIPFHVHELYDEVGDAIGRLGLPGVSVQDRLVVNGRDLQHGLEPQVQQALLPTPLRAPAAKVDAALVRRLRDAPNGRARPYLTVCVNGWSGEVVVTIFLRFALLPDQDLLFVEASYSLLPPSRDRYRKVDQLLSHPTVLQLLKLAGESLVRFPIAVLRAFLNMARVVLSPLTQWLKARRDRWAILDDRVFNYGAVVSIRELGNDNAFHQLLPEARPGALCQDGGAPDHGRDHRVHGEAQHRCQRLLPAADDDPQQRRLRRRRRKDQRPEHRRWPGLDGRHGERRQEPGEPGLPREFRSEDQMNENSGIYAGDSASIRAVSMAAGTNARAITNQAPQDELAELRRRLDAIITELREIAPGDPELEKAVATAEELDGELENEQPDNNKILQLLAKLGVRVENVGNIAAAVAAVDSGFRALL
ncbi:hypothetical protein ACGFNU_00320 [Spirillospora sp. NPDC048911]|uniref:hypothetical protein n=1 Tax=Spirillospora sp. NPDC048911 TaxID=3364527 RepID=UPI00371A9BF1